jgi:hypothetical protein
MTTLSDYMRPEDIDKLIDTVCELADIDTSQECGCHSDPTMDELILAARKIRDREGFLVVSIPL